MDSINKEYDSLVKKIEKNIINWYSFDENKKYIIINGLDKSNINDFEEKVKNLNDEIVLICVDNKNGLNNFCYKNDDTEKLYNKKEIDEILQKYNLIYKKYYYSLPDCNKTNVIFTDDYLPTTDTISRDVSFYNEDSINVYNEVNEYKKLLNLDPELFKLFANSFFIECSKCELVENNIKFVSYSNMRKDKYRIKTIIQGDKVYKKEASEKSIEHIKQIKENIDMLNKIGIKTLDYYNDEGIISDFQKESKTLDKIILENLEKNNIEYVNNLLSKFYNILNDKLVLVNNSENVFDKYGINYDENNIQNLTFIKYGFWDLTFQNVFYINDEFFVYDQEWIEENIPLEFIIFRAFFYNNEINRRINLEDIYKLFNINQENLKIFVELDNKIQEKIRDKLSWKYNSLDNNVFNKLVQLKNDKEKILEDCKTLLNQKDARIKFLEENMEKTVQELNIKNNELTYLKNSRVWKTIQFFRRIKNRKNKAL